MIYLMLIKHDNFKSILTFESQHSWKNETCLITDKLDQVIFEVVAYLTVKMVQIAEIYPHFSSV